jgi:hypothetical protein
MVQRIEDLEQKTVNWRQWIMVTEKLIVKSCRFNAALLAGHAMQ